MPTEVNTSTTLGVMSMRMPQVPTLVDIIRQVAEKYRVPSMVMLSHKRTAVLNQARLEGYYRCLTETKLSIGIICRLWDRDHSTIYKGSEAHAERYGLPSYKEFRPGYPTHRTGGLLPP